MTTKQRVLQALLAHEADWCSGDALAGELGLSRESVWKAINALRKAGHEIEARKSQGYRYVPTPYLDAEVIAFYAGDAAPAHLAVDATPASTQDVAKQWLATQVEPGVAAFVADGQTHGYGRRRRPFYSPAHTGLYLSVVLPNSYGDLRRVGLLTTGVATATLRALRRFFPEAALGLKWVNDIVQDGRKVGGILCEAVLELESATSGAFVVGIGLNLDTATFPQALSGVAGALTQAPVDRNRLAAAILQEVLAMDYQAGAFLDEYRAASTVLGKTVTLAIGERRVQGRAVAIADDGGLVLATAAGEQTYQTGEVVKVDVQA